MQFEKEIQRIQARLTDKIAKARWQEPLSESRKKEIKSELKSIERVSVQVLLEKGTEGQGELSRLREVINTGLKEIRARGMSRLRGHLAVDRRVNSVEDKLEGLRGKLDEASKELSRQKAAQDAEVGAREVFPVRPASPSVQSSRQLPLQMDLGAVAAIPGPEKEMSIGERRNEQIDNIVRNHIFHDPQFDRFSVQEIEGGFEVQVAPGQIETVRRGFEEYFKSPHGVHRLLNNLTIEVTGNHAFEAASEPLPRPRPKVAALNFA